LRRQEYRQPPISFDTPDKEHPDRRIQWTDNQTPTPEKYLERKLFEEAFNRAVCMLPVRQRAAFLLNRFNNASYRDVAIVLGCSESSVKSLIHRATVTLRDYLKDYIIKGE
jgi:RNA polymerase sigma-70 factor (ECF subfamily)